MTNKRLNKIVELFEQDNVYDIGSDHAKLVEELFKLNKISKATICEINLEPLNNAKKTLQNRKNCSFYLSDGLKEVQEIINSDTGIVIAGMGANTIIHILDSSLDKIQDANLYLQPNNNEDKLRLFLNQNGFGIKFECVVLDKNIYYNIMVAKKQEQLLSEEECFLGKNIVVDQNYYAKVRNEYEYLLSLEAKILESNNSNPNLSKKIDMYKTFLGEK